MDEQLLLIGYLNNSLAEDVENYKKIVQSSRYWSRECSKTAIKRKITILRAELLKLERMVSNA